MGPRKYCCIWWRSWPSDDIWYLITSSNDAYTCCKADDLAVFSGESAGAGSVTMHMVSPLSKDLFHRGIAESGSIPAQWTVSYEPLKPAHRLAQILGCPIDSTKLLVKCLQNKPVDRIVKSGLYNDLGVSCCRLLKSDIHA